MGVDLTELLTGKPPRLHAFCLVRQGKGIQMCIRDRWCGDRACEDAIKEKFSATARNMPFDQTPVGDTCVCCGKPAKHLVFWARAY